MINLFRSIFDQAAVGIVQLSLSGQVQLVNPHLATLLHSPAATLLERSLWELFHWGNGEPDLAEIYQILKAGTASFSLEKCCLRRDGSPLWVELVISLAEEGPQRSEYFIGIVRDISDRKATEARLQQSEQQFRSLSICSPVGIFTTNPQGHCTWINPRLEAIADCSLTEVLGENWMGFLHPDDREWVSAEWQKHARAGWAYSAEFRLCRGDGSVRWVTGSTAPLVSDRGDLMGHVGTIGDITDYKDSEIALSRSEATNFALLHAIPDMMFRLHRDGTYLDFKPAKTFPPLREPENFLGKKVTDVIPPDLAQATLERIEQALQTGVEQEHEYQLFNRGVLHDYESRFVACGPDEVLCMVREITDRKRVEAELRQLNETLEQLVAQRTAELVTVFNTLPDYIFVVERDTMRLPFCNDLLAQIAGFERREDLEGKTIFECFPPENAAYFMAQNLQVFETGETIRVQESFTLPGGTLHLDTFKIPLKKPDGEVYALIGTSRDVTDLVQARQALAQRTHQLEIINQELESFSYSVSHDLRAPLRHINGFVTALSQQLEQNGTIANPRIAHYLKVIQTSSHWMGQLIDGLLTLSRVGRRQLVTQPVDLDRLVQTAINLVRDQNPEDTKSEVQFCVGHLPIVMGDPVLLQQIFTNLIDNAVKFSRDRRPAQIEINVLPDGTLFVKDNGVGFQSAYADQIFGAFQRLHPKSEFEGTGIGLAIVQRIIHRHHGTIWVESNPDQGACFFFRLGQGVEG